MAERIGGGTMRARTIGLISAAALAAAGCSGAASAGSSAGGGGGIKEPNAPATSKVLGAAAGSRSAGFAAHNGVQQDANVNVTKVVLPKQRSTIIKTGKLSLRLSGSAITGAVPAVDAIASRYGGYTLSTEST